MKSAAINVFSAVLRRDLLLGLRHRSELANPLIFYVIVVSLFPFALGNDPVHLRLSSTAIIWVCALLASTLSMDRIFDSDFGDGSLEQFVLSEHPLTLLVSAKIAAHWLLHGVPLIIAALALALLYRMDAAALPALFLTLLLGTPVLSLIGAVMSALTVGLRNSGILLALLILPLYVPVLIFAVGAVSNARLSLPVTAELYFLGALLVLSIVLMPAAAAASVRIRLG
ncbi:MAG: heme exporter protein CcmB [Burkholderiales bacterium]